MTRRNEIKEKEIEFLAQEYKKSPQFFERGVFLEGPELLEKFGIFIKNQKEFPLGFLKLWPQDFIVEEISDNNEIQTIYPDKFFAKEEKFPARAATIYATLVKCGISTIEAIEEISESLGADKKNIQFAGIKDKDAITSQKISFRKISPEKLQQLSSSYFFLKNAFPGKGVAEKGALRGNRFTILVRTEKNFKKEIFLRNLKEIEKHGFYNFYYLQRFGTPRLINFHWGLSILKGEYKKAVLGFLSSVGERELLYFQRIRNETKNNFGDWEKIEKILESLPLMLQNELKIVRHLKEKPDDFRGALNQIPEQITLWVFALSSWLFNNKLSSYIKRGKELPETFPLFLSRDKEDWLFYQDFLKKLGIFPPPLHNLKPFSYIQLRRRRVETKKEVEIEKVKIIPEGVILRFSLAKAVYATTFLAHLFRLISGMPPKYISSLAIDTKATLGEESLEDVLNRFKDVIRPKTENTFEKFL